MCSDQGTLETLSHVFMDCTTSARLWAAGELGIMSSVGQECRVQVWICNWIKYLAKRNDQKRGLCYFLSTINSIWALWNDLKYNGKVFNPIGAVKLIEEGTNLASIKNSKLLARGKDSDIGQVGRCDDVDDSDSLTLEAGSPSFLIGKGGFCFMSLFKVDAA
ncbi:hypothetical protein RND81_10G019800 [Saponaria officinalis]|uniref:Reverse transcriptase zinc-binding domain-containing protein n=1 Tax=Saponaria officinalis TaxID=3572 RepID=A0AAW1HXR9_SAPOF